MLFHPGEERVSLLAEKPTTVPVQQGAQVTPGAMNLSSEPCNISDWLRLEATVKASVYAIIFCFATSLTVLIVAIVAQSLRLRQEARYLLLCHHLLCISSYCGLGLVFQAMRALRAGSPLLLCWLVFGVQLSMGEGILFTLALMAADAYLVICWPLKSLSIRNAAKSRVLAGTWLVIILKNVCLFILEGTSATQVAILRSEPLCPVVLNGVPARAAGLVVLVLLLSVILVSYSLIYQEGRRAGHFSRSNVRARKTILIHLAQMGLHVVPTLLFVGLGKICGLFYFALNLTLFGVFAFAQCCSPLVYGLWNRELQSRLCRWVDCQLWCGHGSQEEQQTANLNKTQPF